MLNNLLVWLFDPAGLPPHGLCLLWEPTLVWTYVISDAGIALAYFTIPLALAVVARRRRDLIFRPMFWLFASFISLCGTTHLLDVLTLWVPAYGLAGVIKAVTAFASIVAAIALWGLLPKALALPSAMQLREANAALRESEGRYRANFDHSPIPMLTLDGVGILTGVSLSWLALLGYSEQEVIGHHLSDFCEGAGIDNDLAELVTDIAVRDLERSYRRRDGGLVDVLMSARLERGKGLEQIVCVLVDVSERRKIEEALRAGEQRLHQSQKMEVVGQLTGGIAHDFNNMLQSITGSLELLELRISQGRVAEAARYIAAARTAAETAAALTNRMLAFARRQILQPTVLEPGTLLREMTQFIQSGTGPTIRLELCLQDGGWSVASDAGQLQSALLNLALNARDAMPEGGTLQLSTADRTLTLANLADQDDVEPGQYVEIAVSDTGTGMGPEVLLRAFEPFFTTRPFGRGTGLGLSQVYGFVRQSGGFVRLESRLGAGTKVLLFLPRKERPSRLSGTSVKNAALAPNIPLTASMASSGTVLVVEDDDRIRGMIVDVLTEQRYSVIEAADGPSGLRIVQSSVRLDLLLTDMSLPGLNGRQLAEAARTTRPDLPVLLITGYAASELNDTDLLPDMQLLRKPFTFDTLSGRVRDLVNRPLVKART